MRDNFRITYYFRNGLVYISISQLKNKDNNVLIILPIFGANFIVFLQKKLILLYIWKLNAT